MAFSYEINNRVMVAKIGQELDHHHAEEIRKKIDDVIQYDDIKALIFDFSNTQFMDSSGIGVIMGRYKLMKEVGGGVGLIGVNSHIQKLFKLSGLYRLVKEYESLQEAIEDLS